MNESDRARAPARSAPERRQDDFHLLVEGIRDYGIFMLDPEGIVRTWNSGASRMSGYSEAEIVGQHFSRLYPAGDISAGKPAIELQTASSVGRFEEEGWRVRKDGSQFWASVVLTALRDPGGNLRGFGKVTRDLTDRRRVEELLRDSEQRFRLMVEGVKDYAIIMLSPDGKIVSWNPGAQRIKGWSADEIVGQGFERFYPPEDVESGKTAMELKTASESGTFEDLGWRVRKDGSRFWANVVITALRRDDGTLTGFAKITRDITERKGVEDRLANAFHELEAFSYTVSHDLRAPLRSIDGFSDELFASYKDKLDARGQGYLRRIRESAQQMARLIDDLIKLSRVGTGALNRESIDLSELAVRVARELKGREPTRQVEVVVAPGLEVSADRSLIRIVLENLLGNAWKYTSRHATGRIEVGVEELRGRPVYFVRDDGAGFDMRYQEKLFGAFQRLHPAEQFSGTGIGLATVKRIVERHGGSVSATGAVEAGATFTFTLGGTNGPSSDQGPESGAAP